MTNTLNNITLNDMNETNPIAALLNGENEVVRVYDTVEEAFDAAQGTDHIVAHEEWLASQSMGYLAEIYNKSTRSIQIKRFSTKEVAVQRVLKLFGEIQVDDAMAAVEAAPAAVEATPEAVTVQDVVELMEQAAAPEAAKPATATSTISRDNAIAELANEINQEIPQSLANAKVVEVSVKLGKGRTVYIAPSTKDESCRVYVMGTARTTLAPIIASFLGQEATESKGASTFKVGTHSDVINLIADLITAC